MTGDATLDAIRIFVALVAVAGLVGVVVRRIAIPYTVTLVVLGLAASIVLSRDQVSVTPELVLLVLVPGLVFESAIGLNLTELRRTFGGILLLAAPGVLISAAIVAVVLNVVTGLPLGLGFVVGAMVAATDPVAVLAIFRRIGAPKALTTLVEGESLFNDGTALVVFAIAVTAVGTEISLGASVIAFVSAVAISVAIGLVAGWLASRLVATVDDHLVELTLSLATAYGTYLIADGVGESGIIATVVAGVVIGNYGRTHGMSQTTREALDVVWEFIAYVLTAIAFLLIGLSISFGDLAAAALPIAAGVAAILIGRVVVVYVLLGGTSRLARAIPTVGRWLGRGPGLPIGWLHVMFWAGLRGAVGVAMALSLPQDFPQRALLQETTFGIVLFTLFVQGTTAERLVRRVVPAEG